MAKREIIYLKQATNFKIRTLYLFKLTFCFSMDVDLEGNFFIKFNLYENLKEQRVLQKLN